ncbi:hypothetical protein KCU65_g173, partial [Aureobasidium melanogenum]
MVSFCSAPSSAEIHLGLVGANNSTLGLLWFKTSPSKVPALTIFMPGKFSPSRYKVDPQSPQKYEVIFLPLSAVLVKLLGLPVTLKPSPDTTLLTLYALPLIFWQSTCYFNSKMCCS